MGSVGLKTSTTNVTQLVSRLADYDQRFSDDVVRAAQDVHDDFPEINEIFSVRPAQLAYGTGASMNGLGFLEINERLLKDYESTLRELTEKGHWLAGDGTFKSIVTHELAHNVDLQFSQLLWKYAPTGAPENITINSKNWAEIYSEALGREIKAGDTIAEPTSDRNAKFVTIDGEKFSTSDFDSSRGGATLSKIVVPRAIANIQRDWKQLGYASQPSAWQLTNAVSGYARDSYVTGTNTNDEIFAECYTNYKSHGSNASPLAQEVMRLTNQAYRSVVSRKPNLAAKHFDKVFKVRDRRKKEREAQKNAE